MGKGFGWKALWGLRAVVAVLMVAGFVGGGARSVAAQGGASGIDGNSYRGDDYDWSVEWDEDLWAEPREVDSSDGDMLQLSLVTPQGEFVAAVTLWANTGFSGDVERCADRYDDDLLEERDSVSDVAEATEVDLPRAPRGQANAAYAYVMDFEDGSSLELIDYVQCRTLVDGDAVLMAWMTARPKGYEMGIADFAELLEGIEVDEAAAAAVSGIDGDTYESPTYGFTFEWDDEVWEVDAAEELAGSGREQIDGIGLLGQASYLEIEARTAFDGDARDCLDDQVETMEGDASLARAEPLEDRRGDPVEGRTADGGRYVAYVLTFENEDGSDEDVVQYVECRPLQDGESVLIFSLMSYPDEYEDELDAAEEIFETLEV